MRGIGVLGVMICLAATMAAAQNVSLAPTFGTAALRAGFVPDPTIVPMVAGGPMSFTLDNCGGYISEAPDYRVTFTAAATPTRPLSFSVESAGDTVLLINAPDGTWVCNDDFYDLDPAISFANPASGQYDIWIGTFAPGQSFDAWLVAAEFHIE